MGGGNNDGQHTSFSQLASPVQSIVLLSCILAIALFVCEAEGEGDVDHEALGHEAAALQ